VAGIFRSTGKTGIAPAARPPCWVRFTYNPWRGETFHRATVTNPAPVYGAKTARFDREGAFS
jgi:hypothetical protein